MANSTPADRRLAALSVPDESALGRCAARLAQVLRGHEYVALRGPLGSGKTSFARALLRALGHDGAVKSPTFTLVEPYELGPLQVLHMDLYRLRSARELEMLGIREQFGAAVLLIEWPENGAPWLPVADLEIQFDYCADGGADCSTHAVAIAAAGADEAAMAATSTARVLQVAALTAVGEPLLAAFATSVNVSGNDGKLPLDDNDWRVSVRS